jgi:serine/threonine protein kinase
VIKALDLEPYQGSLFMTLEDIGGQSLDRWIRQGRLDIAQCLSLALELGEIIGSIHRERLIHKAINPAHILWNPETAQLRLIDFGLADDLLQHGVELQHPAALQGTLAYISPEQTGRVNRFVDYRTDFYSFGITLYQMFTGKLPFEADDALGLVHCHIAQTAIPPAELNPAIPEMISEIVMKLIAKMPEDRYQSSEGLKADLEYCQRYLSANVTIPYFALGRKDTSKQFRIPQKLYGRTEEIDRLLAAFEHTCEGGRDLLLVNGYAGSGKTALVHEIRRAITIKQGNFIEGKFDQWERQLPYSGWIQAFNGLVHYLLMESEPRLAAWREHFGGSWE